MVDVNKQIRRAVKSGKVGFGSKDALSSAASARAKLIILAKNCRESDREDILHNAIQSEVPVYIFPAPVWISGRSARNPSRCPRWSSARRATRRS